jgi:hypothetical protein
MKGEKGDEGELMVAIGAKPKEGEEPPESSDEEGGEREAAKDFLALARGADADTISDEDADALVVAFETLRRATG